MDSMASQITNLTIVYSTVLSGANQRKHQSSASLAFVRRIHRWPVHSPHKWPVTRKWFPFDDVIMRSSNTGPWSQSVNVTSRNLLRFHHIGFLIPIIGCGHSTKMFGKEITSAILDGLHKYHISLYFPAIIGHHRGVPNIPGMSSLRTQVVVFLSRQLSFPNCGCGLLNKKGSSLGSLNTTSKAFYFGRQICHTTKYISVIGQMAPCKM